MPFSDPPTFKPPVPPIALGALGSVLVSQGLLSTTPPEFLAAAPGAFLDIQVFTAASSLFTPNPAANAFLFWTLGDGGGSASALWTAAGSAAGGGGGGGFSLVYYHTPFNFGSTATIQVGQGGAGGTAGAAGSTGSNTVVTWTGDPGGADITANGGHGGPVSVDGKSINPGAAGGASANTLGGLFISKQIVAYTGGPGGAGLVIAGWGQGGAGGAAQPFGQGTQQQNPTQTHFAGRNGQLYGCGAAGSVNLDSQTSNGNSGAPGICIIWEFG